MVCLYQQEGLQYYSLVAKVLKEKLNLHTVEKGSFKIPAASFNFMRNQYEAEKIIDALLSGSLKGCELLLYLVGVDIYVPRMNFIFGLALPQKKVALVSTYRLVNGDMLNERLKKEIIHEMGHLLSLDHCKNSRCVMHFSNTIFDTDLKGIDFCSNCRGKLEKL